MYKAVNAIQPVFLKYAASLVQQGVVTEQDKTSMLDKLYADFDASYLQSKNVEFDKAEWSVRAWEQIKPVEENVSTGIS